MMDPDPTTNSAREELFVRVEAVRESRARARDRVRTGELDYAGIFDLAESDPSIASMKLLPLIETLPDVGKVQSRRALAVLSLDETIRVDELPRSARDALFDLLVGDRLSVGDVAGQSV